MSGSLFADLRTAIKCGSYETFTTSTKHMSKDDMLNQV